MKVEIDKHLISFVIIGICLLQDGAHSQIKVAVSSESEFVNEGDDFVAYCNITGLRPYDILRIKVQWLHNGKRISDYCKLLDYDLYSKYSCRLLSPKPGDLIVEQTILNVQLEDAGFLECEVVEAMREYSQIIGKDIEAKQSVPIRIRGCLNCFTLFGASLSGSNILPSISCPLVTNSYYVHRTTLEVSGREPSS
uniref:Uncharacterized protein LOC111111289 isoform X2 n=1 Tax=Crassostrea virginica TaxID=6565 RepID=A0A8B8BM09_CRAVI|nr:uncharacterized protein LOC111111289 isoform X2 [Crassostrea virginica]